MKTLLEISTLAVVAVLVIAVAFHADRDANRHRTTITVERRGALRPWRWTVRDRATGRRLRCGTARTRVTAWLTAYTTVVDEHLEARSSAIADGHPSIPTDELAARRTERSRRAHPSGTGRTSA